MSNPVNDNGAPRTDAELPPAQNAQERPIPRETSETGHEPPMPEPRDDHNRRKLPWILLLTFIVGVSGAGLSFVGTTERGLQWAFSILARNIPGTLRVDHLAGRLIGPLSIRGLHYSTAKKNITLSIEKLEADIRPLPTRPLIFPRGSCA